MDVTVNKLETTFEKARAYYGRKADKDEYILQLAQLEQFMEEQGWDEEMEDDDFVTLKRDFMTQQENAQCALVVCNRIVKLLAQQRANSPASLLKAPLFRKSHLFEDTIKTTPPQGDLSKAVEDALTEQFSSLWALEKMAASNRVAFTEYMVSAYHESKMSLHEYCVQSPLLMQCRESGKIALYEQLQRYLVQYEHTVARPLPTSGSQAISGHRYNDNINIVLSYMNEINSALHLMVTQRAFPLQLDVYFVAPGCHQNLNLDGLRGLDAEHRSDTVSRATGAVDGTSDVYWLLRAANHDMTREHRQRFILLVVRGNPDDAVNDTMYVYRPEVANEIAAEHVSDYVEMSYLVNSKSPIVEGLASDAEGVLGVCHHLHAQECGKVYVSYGAHKSRVFKDGLLDRLGALFDKNNYCRHLIGMNAMTEFAKSYCDFKDARFGDIGRYWFDIEKAYECWEPAWNPDNCRAMGNVYISKECTRELINKIDEQYDSAQRLYYRMDYTVGMQIVDRETVHFKFAGDERTDFTLIHMDLHRGDEALYAVVVPNCHKSKQKWKVEYDGLIGGIEGAFMMKQEVMAKYGIFACDLPRGSRVKHDNFEEQLDRIEVNRQLIRNTNWSHIRIVQSKQNCARSGMTSGRNRRRSRGSGKQTARSVCGHMICCQRFKQLAIESLSKLESRGAELTPIAHFEFRRNKYHLEKLLPVRIPNEGLVAVSFYYNEKLQKTQASGVCLDLTDIRNKANLVRSTEDDESSCLCEPADDNKATINNLLIEECEKQCNHRGRGPSRKQRRARPRKAPHHGGPAQSVQSKKDQHEKPKIPTPPFHR